ncbi:MAG: hypothetical protein WDN29_10740 [Methylovirgula sp.]
MAAAALPGQVAQNGSFRSAIFDVQVNGQDVSTRWQPIVTRVVILQTLYGTSDAAEVTLDDETQGQIALPFNPGIGSSVPISVALGWEDDPNYSWYAGWLTAPVSTGSRGQGRMLTLTSASIDPKGQWKSTRDLHMDGGSFSGFMQMVAPPGMNVTIHPSIANIERDYWYAGNESFTTVAQRYADQMGLTFKVQGNTAVFTPRGLAVTASGAALGTVNAIVGQNVLNWSLSPIYNRMDYLGMDAMFYDPAAAQWNKASGTGAQQGASPDSGSQAVLKDRNKQANQANAQSQASANATEAGMLRGGGTIELDGCPEAVVGAVCNVQGTRPGIDGSYLIYQGSTHVRSREGLYHEFGGDAAASIERNASRCCLGGMNASVK